MNRKAQWFFQAVLGVVFLGVACLVMAVDATAAVQYAGDQYSDPFGALPGSQDRVIPENKVEAPPPILDGIAWSPKRPQAVVNGTLVGIGSVIGQVEIVDITRESVKARSNGKDFFLKRKEGGLI